ncbi:MAG: methionine synthase [Geodermatophilaceae bacterium]|nr:methionine synthase [Geodermatophilaceae bacterium]
MTSTATEPNIGWPPATGIGSLPGTDPVAALRHVLDLLPDGPHLPELPDRGPGADLIGRGAGLLLDLAVDLQPSGWRFVPRPGMDLGRTRDLWARDLDALAQEASDYRGWFKIQVTGPWTLAAGVELHRGDKAVADAGAARDIAESLAGGLAEHLAILARAIPHADLVVQLDEPSLPAVLRGGVRTASGFGRLAAVEEPVVESALRTVLQAAGPLPTVVHCCAADVPIELLRRTGPTALSLDLTLTFEDDEMGVAVESGTALLLGVVPGTDSGLPAPRATADRLRAWWRRLGFDPENLPGTVTLTPSCGLAGASPAYAATCMAHLHAAGRDLAAG